MGLVSAHKLGGPKGIGALVLRRGLDVAPQDVPSGFSVDHVVPQSVFDASPRKMEGVRLGNLVPIPKRLNSIKNNKVISKMADAEIKRYANYSSLDSSALRTFTDCNNMPDVAALLRPVYIDEFLAKRRELINR
jgi:selenocysteine lyase/cysteine desulfurase